MLYSWERPLIICEFPECIAIALSMFSSSALLLLPPPGAPALNLGTALLGEQSRHCCCWLRESRDEPDGRCKFGYAFWLDELIGE